MPVSHPHPYDASVGESPAAYASFATVLLALSIAQFVMLLRAGGGALTFVALIQVVALANALGLSIPARYRMPLLLAFAASIFITFALHVRTLPRSPAFRVFMATNVAVIVGGVALALRRGHAKPTMVSCAIAIAGVSTGAALLLAGGMVEPRPDIVAEQSKSDTRNQTWVLELHDPGSVASLDVPADAPSVLNVRIARADVPTPFNIQLNEKGIVVGSRQSYALSFRARADAPRTISYGVSMAHAPWLGLGFYRNVAVDQQWRDVSETFTLTAGDSNARIHFDLGGSPISVSLDRVALTRGP